MILSAGTAFEQELGDLGDLMMESKRAEFVELYREFASSYPSTTDGMHHVEAYGEQRAHGVRISKRSSRRPIVEKMWPIRCS
jgi:hypothetical protein